MPHAKWWKLRGTLEEVWWHYTMDRSWAHLISSMSRRWTLTTGLAPTWNMQDGVQVPLQLTWVKSQIQKQEIALSQERVSAWRRGLQSSPTLTKLATFVKQPSWKQLQFVQCSKSMVWDPASQDAAIQDFWESWECHASEEAEEKSAQDIERRGCLGTGYLGRSLEKGHHEDESQIGGWPRWMEESRSGSSSQQSLDRVGGAAWSM